MSKGRLVIVSGPSGSGKDTILKEVLKRIPEMKFSISSITRPMRPDEVEGEKYNFVSVEYFEEMIKNDQLLEYNNYVGNYYGTPKAPIDKVISEGGEIIIEVDVNGQKNIKSRVDSALSIFIMPPSIEVLRTRLQGRGTDSDEIIKKRMIEARAEIECAKNYDFIVVNDDLEEAVNDFVNIIKTDRLSLERQKNIIDEVLKKC
ncbi:MAG: guanylate kinase [Acutalibacteraceae bacterium]|nr:guanylate kinase [Acutalibacteraceae bacterium]